MGRRPYCEKEGVNRGAWTAMEDRLLTDYITLHGGGRWRSLPKKAGLKRCGKSCRMRWLNYLRPDIKRGNITADEEDLIIRLHKLLGNRWTLIAGRLPGRTDNEIKNYWKTRCKRVQRGDDPHKQIDSTLLQPRIPYNSSSPTVIRTVAVKATRVFTTPPPPPQPPPPPPPTPPPPPSTYLPMPPLPPTVANANETTGRELLDLPAASSFGDFGESLSEFFNSQMLPGLMESDIFCDEFHRMENRVQLQPPEETEIGTFPGGMMDDWTMLENWLGVQK